MLGRLTAQLMEARWRSCGDRGSLSSGGAAGQHFVIASIYPGFQQGLEVNGDGSESLELRLMALLGAVPGRMRGRGHVDGRRVRFAWQTINATRWKDGVDRD